MKILFVCTGNSARSQMAEGLARSLAPGIEAHSAGLDPRGVNPYAVEVMTERGIDISGQRSKFLDETLAWKMDRVITLCGDAAESCPAFPPVVRVHHWPFEDPAKAEGSPDEVRAVFRKVRDEIEARLRGFLEEARRGSGSV